MQKNVNWEMTIGKEWLECKSHWHYKQDHYLVLGISWIYWIHSYICSCQVKYLGYLVLDSRKGASVRKPHK